MEAALTNSSSSLNLISNRLKPLSSSKPLFTKPEIRFFPTQKPNNNGDFSSSMSLQFKPIEPVSCSSFSSLLQVGVGNVEALAEETGESKTVHVRFQLQKECSFGEQFLIVGNDPMFGMWDPALAIPLNWSEGHVWGAELDIPIGRTIHFKFILKGSPLNVMWQPGQDRIMQTWETNNTIVVDEHWECAELQNIREEPVVNLVEETVDDPEKELTITENIMDLVEEPSAESKKEVTSADDKTNSEEQHQEEAIFLDSVFASNGTTATEKMPTRRRDNKNWVDYDGEPVLVPGLKLPRPPTTKEVSVKEVEPVLVPGLKLPRRPTTKEVSVKEVEPVLVAGLKLSRRPTTKEVSVKEVESNGVVDTSPRPKAVMVPGLTPLPKVTIEEVITEKIKSSGIVDTSAIAEDTSAGSDESESENKHEIPGKHGINGVVSMFSDDALKDGIGFKQKPPVTDEQEKPESQTGEDNVLLGNDFQRSDKLEKDIQWGRNTVRKLLDILGFGLLIK